MQAATVPEPAAPEVQLIWPQPPARVELDGNDIHVWSAWLLRPDFDYPSAHGTLNDAERRRAEQFHFERDRKHFIARRSLLRCILGQYLKTPPAGVHFAYEAHGKPTLFDPSGKVPLHFNFTHSRNLALCAVSRASALGVDIEKIRPMPERDEIASTFFSTEENALLRAAAADRKTEQFFNTWTRKEAYLKATGEGIAGSLSEIDCSQAPDPWSLYGLGPAPGYIGALASARGAPSPHCWQWTAQMA